LSPALLLVSACGQTQNPHATLTEALLLPGMRGATEASIGGAVRMGVSTEATGAEASGAALGTATARCPEGMAAIDGYCIDRYEAYVVELDDAQHETAHSPFEPVTGLKVRAKVAPDVTPQGYISQVEARGACENAGKRLCSAHEFERACRGPDPKASYPYGGTHRAPGACNEGKGSTVAVFYGMNAAYDNSQLNDPRMNQWSGGLAKTGAYKGCESPSGVFDLVGNLHEWGAETSDSGRGYFRGGYYGDAEINGSGCAYVTRAHSRNYHDYSTGFRCCSDAP